VLEILLVPESKIELQLVLEDVTPISRLRVDLPEPTQLPPPVCPHCANPRTARVKRKGLLQTLLWHRLGLFPWECSGCRKIFLFKSRGKLKRKRRTTGEVHLPPVA
jgi:hypothetical protein